VNRFAPERGLADLDPWHTGAILADRHRGQLTSWPPPTRRRQQHQPSWRTTRGDRVRRVSEPGAMTETPRVTTYVAMTNGGRGCDSY
jgi:hypothetical protein